MNSVDTTSQQLMDAIGEQRRLRRREDASGSWRKYSDTKWPELQDEQQHEDDVATAALAGDASLVEPPLSLNADGERNYHLVGTIFDIPLHNVSYGGGMAATAQHHLQQQYTSNAATVVPASNQSTPINLSPLTATSVCAMEKEYDRDTWRMYQRIKSARTVPTHPPAIQHQHSNSMPQMHFRPTSGADHCGSEVYRHDFESGYASSVPNSVSPLNLVSYHNHDDDGGDDYDEIFEMDLDS